MCELDVLMPIAKRHEYLADALASIRSSNKVDLRVVFVDNGQEDLHLEDFAGPNDIIIKAPVIGYASALNKALDADIVWSDYVALMNSDDLVDPNRFLNQITTIKKFNSDLSICKIKRIDSNGKERSSFYGDFAYDAWHPLLLLFGSYGADATWLSTRDWWLDNGRRNENLHPDLVDLDLALRVFPSTEISVDCQSVYFYRSHKSQMSRNKYSMSDFQSLEKQFKNFLDSFGIGYPGMETLYLLRPRSVNVLSLRSSRRGQIRQMESFIDLLSQHKIKSVTYQNPITPLFRYLGNQRVQILKPARRIILLLMHFFKSLSFLKKRKP